MGWFFNCLAVYGAAADIDALLDHVRGESEGRPLLLDFDRARPVPADLVERLVTFDWDGAEGWWKDGTLRPDQVRLIRGDGHAAFAIECKYAPPITIVAALARRFPELAFWLLWAEPSNAGSGVITYDREGVFHETWVAPEDDAYELLRSAGWDDRTWPLTEVLPNVRWLQFGECIYSLDEIVYELENGCAADERPVDLDVAAAVSDFTRHEVTRMVALAARQRTLVREEEDVDDLALLCRAALRVVAERLELDG